MDKFNIIKAIKDNVEVVLKGVDMHEIGIDCTYHTQLKTLWLRFLWFYITFKFGKNDYYRVETNEEAEDANSD